LCNIICHKKWTKVAQFWEDLSQLFWYLLYSITNIPTKPKLYKENQLKKEKDLRKKHNCCSLSFHSEQPNKFLQCSSSIHIFQNDKN